MSFPRAERVPPMPDPTPTPPPQPASQSGAPSPGAPVAPGAGVEQALRQAEQAFEGLRSTMQATPSRAGSVAAGPGALRMLDDVDLDVRIELGRTRMLVEDVLRLGRDSVVELDKAAGDPVDIYVNGRHIARGEVLVVNENFCVRVSEILEPLQGG